MDTYKQDLEKLYKDQGLLAIQAALRSGVHSLESLQKTLSIQVHEHSVLPLVGFSYHQIDSPKTDPIVRESRGLTLEKDTWKIAAKSFNRFFNLGEVQEEYARFNWSNFESFEKVDGSLMLLFYYNGDWHVKTRGSFTADAPFDLGTGQKIKFSDLFWKILKDRGFYEHLTNLPTTHTYVFELCSLYNQVVRLYDQPTIFLLSIFNNLTGIEQENSYVDDLANQWGVSQPVRYNFNSAEEIDRFLKGLQQEDPTFEGLVIKDSNQLRYKIKTETYLALHHMVGNGELYTAKRLVPFVLTEDPSELFLRYPSAKEPYEKVAGKMDSAYQRLKEVWLQTHHIESQKDFALAIRGKTPFTSILFELRKATGTKTEDNTFVVGPQNEEDLKTCWRSSADLIYKVLFK